MAKREVHDPTRRRKTALVHLVVVATSFDQGEVFTCGGSTLLNSLDSSTSFESPCTGENWTSSSRESTQTHPESEPHRGLCVQVCRLYLATRSTALSRRHQTRCGTVLAEFPSGVHPAVRAFDGQVAEQHEDREDSGDTVSG
jgi:hypothetical protein